MNLQSPTAIELSSSSTLNEIQALNEVQEELIPQEPQRDQLKEQQKDQQLEENVQKEEQNDLESELQEPQDLQEQPHEELQEMEHTDDIDEPFNKIDQLELPSRLRKRAEEGLLEIVESIIEEDLFKEEEIEESTKRKCCNAFCFPDKSCCHWPTGLDVTPMSPKLSISLSQGNKITKKLFFPTMPKIFRDFWVFLELSVTLFQLIFSLINIQFTTNRIYNVLYISLSSVNTALACFDAFTYYYQLGSCNSCLAKVRKKKQINELKEENNETRVTCKTKYLKILKTWLEVFRSIISELLLYPLVILDLFELLGENTFNVANQSQTITFIIFVVSNLYFVLNVYIVRIIMLCTTIFTFKKISSSNLSQNIEVIIRFLIHVIGQIVVHFLCIAAVGVKIHQENSVPHTGDYRVTPFLWFAILSGWIIPLLGTIGFFVLNYYWVQMFSIGLFLDMMSLLEGQSFGQALLRSKKKISEDTQEKTEKILKKIEFTKIKKEFVERNEASFFAKLLYPLKVPVFIIYAIFYNALSIAFCISLIFTLDSNGNVQSAIGNSDNTSTLLLVVIALIITANLHLVLVTNLWCFVCVLFIFFTVLFPSLAFLSGPIVLVMVLVFKCISRK